MSGEGNMGTDNNNRAGEGHQNTPATLIQPLKSFLSAYDLATPEPVTMTTVGFCSNSVRY